MIGSALLLACSFGAVASAQLSDNKIPSYLRFSSIAEVQSDYGCDLPCNDGDVVYEIEAVVQRNRINGNLKDFECELCDTKKPFANVDNVYATLRSFQATSRSGQSPYCEMMNGYNGTNGITGPCLMAKPGQVISIKLINNLDDAMKVLQNSKPSKREWWESAGRPKGVTPNMMKNEADTVENNPGWALDGKVFDVTNLHFHGLEVMPHLFYPLGTSEPTAPWIQAEPDNVNGKQCFCYQMGISKEQSTGTFLYHIHRHGSESMQLWSGMLGLIQIGGSDYKKSLDWELPNMFNVKKDIPFGIWGPSLRYQGTASSYVSNPKKNNDGSTQPKSQASSKVAEMQLNSWHNNGDITVNPVLVNNDYRPTFVFNVDDIVRFRVVCIFVTMFCGFSIVPDIPGINTLDPANQLDFYVISSDGITMKSPVLRKRLVLSSAQRNDILVKFTNAGKFLIRSDGVYDFTAPMPNPDTILAYVEVSAKSTKAKASTPKKIPKDISKWVFTKTPARVPITLKDIKNRRSFMFDSFDPSPKMMPNSLMEINHQTFRVNVVNTEVRAGDAEEWVLKAPADIHTYHIHINPFIVVDVQSDEYGDVLSNPQTRKQMIDDQIGLWRDTVNIPPKGNVTVWTKFSARDPIKDEPYTGKTVYHCHLVDDQDQGMMQNINILP